MLLVCQNFLAELPKMVSALLEIAVLVKAGAGWREQDILGRELLGERCPASHGLFHGFDNFIGLADLLKSLGKNRGGFAD